MDDGRSASVLGAGLEGRLVLLGVTGSIAAYKAAELVRLMAAAGADVQVLDDRAAHRASSGRSRSRRSAGGR